MRVIGFEFAVADPMAAGDTCHKASDRRRRDCPVSPLGDMLSKHDGSSDDQSHGSDSQCTDSDGYYGHHDADDYSYSSRDGYSWQAYGCESQLVAAAAVAAPMDVDAAPFYPTSTPTVSITTSVSVARSTSSTSSEPIPIPKKPKPPKTKKYDEPKNLKRVPEPPMVKAVTAPAVVEEVYAEYDRLKQIAEEDEMYQQMMAAQGQKPRRRLKSTTNTVKPHDPPQLLSLCVASAVYLLGRVLTCVAVGLQGMDLGTEMDKLSWRTVYTYMQSDELPLWAATNSACHCK